MMDRKPFKHMVIDGFWDAKELHEVSASIASIPEDAWYRYDNPLEKKRTCRDLNALPWPVLRMIQKLNSPRMIKTLSLISGCRLQGDTCLHGAGVHVMENGGKLDLHRDYDLHPVLGLERRLNLIIFLTDSWQDQWGGHLEFWSEIDGIPAMREKRIAPMFNRAVLFDPSGYHGCPEPIDCPHGLWRKTLALYYLSKPRGNLSRQRSQFAPKPGEPNTPELDALRKTRSELPVKTVQ